LASALGCPREELAGSRKEDSATDAALGAFPNTNKTFVIQDTYMALADKPVPAG
jgi:hypothetical protein